ncbi:MAG: hypothetical protein LBR91_01670 [Puniceicoccales bacterium]|jgi:hypothetical protein|nr:hypothetical protein [Puniceicoccales bacterium]
MKLLLLIVAIVVICPATVFANAMVSTVAFIDPFLVYLLIPVIIAEVLVMTVVLKKVKAIGIILTATISNIASTIVGIPLTIVLYYPMLCLAGINFPNLWFIAIPLDEGV